MKRLLIQWLDSSRSNERSGTYVVAVSQRRLHLVIQSFLLQSHERRVDDDAQRDEQVDERIHDKQLDEVRELVPASAAFPAEQQLMTLALQILFLTHALLESEKIYSGNETSVIAATVRRLNAACKRRRNVCY